MAGPHIWASRAHVLSRREFIEELKSSSAVKILTDLLTSMNSTFSKQDEQGDFSLHSGILKSSFQVPCWMRLDTKGSLKRAWGRFQNYRSCVSYPHHAHLVRVLQLMLQEDFALWIYVFLPVPVTLKEKVPNHHGLRAPRTDYDNLRRIKRNFPRITTEVRSLVY